MKKMERCTFQAVLPDALHAALWECRRKYPLRPGLLCLSLSADLAGRFSRGLAPRWDSREKKYKLIADALRAYRPFPGLRKEGLNHYTETFKAPVSQAEVEDGLRRAGITNLPEWYRCLLASIIGHPGNALRIQPFGARQAYYANLWQFDNLKGNPVYTGGGTVDATIPLRDFRVLEACASSTGTSVPCVLTAVVQVLCDASLGGMETGLSDRLVRRYLSDFPDGWRPGEGNSLVRMYCSAKCAVKLLAVMERHGIPSRPEVVRRAARMLADIREGRFDPRLTPSGEEGGDWESFQYELLARKAYGREVRRGTR